jgi:hypothetical protein
MEHVIRISGSGMSQEFELASEIDRTVDVVRTLFENAERGEIVEVPVRVPGSDEAGRLIINTANIVTVLVSQKPTAHLSA